MRFVAEMTESASHGTPLTADTLRRFSSAAMPYGGIPARLSSRRPSLTGGGSSAGYTPLSYCTSLRACTRRLTGSIF